MHRGRTEPMKYRIMICDDNANYRMFLRHIFGSDSRFEIAAEADSGREATRIYNEIRPDVVLIDAQMEEKTDGIDAIYDIKQLDGSTKVIVLTAYRDDELVINAFKNGADNYIIKDNTAEQIIRATIDTLNGSGVISQFVANTLKSYVASSQTVSRYSEEDYVKCAKIISNLTKSEIEILVMLHRGFSRERIARARTVEVSTMKTHINNILKKLNYQKSQDAVAYLESIGFFRLFDE